MKIGAVYPQIELRGDPEALARIGVAAEQMGYDYLLMYDHVLGAHPNRTPPLWGPYTDQDPFHDPLVAFAYLSALTQTIEMVIGVLILPQRQTALVARQIADIDLLSKGRLRPCLGIGWNPVEYQALGQDFHTRGKRFDEQITLLRKLWEEPLVSFEGQFDKIDRAALNPRPKRRIPLYCGGFSEPAFKRAAQVADGFLFAADIEPAIEGWQSLQQHLRNRQRPIDGFVAEYLLQNAYAHGLSVDENVVAAQRWQDVGGSSVAVVTMGRGFHDVDQHIDHLKESIDKLRPNLG